MLEVTVNVAHKGMTQSPCIVLTVCQICDCFRYGRTAVLAPTGQMYTFIWCAFAIDTCTS